jgi:perosamine synthetase
MIPIYQPYFTKKSLSYAHETLDLTWVSSHGKYIQIIEEKLKELLNVKYVLPVNNGTSACHLLSKSLTNKFDKNEIIVPDNVYVAAWNAFLFDKNYKLLSIGSDIDTWNIDLAELDEKINLHPNAAVLIVHNIGNIINVPELQKKYPNTVFVEDNCEGFLGKYNNTQSGTASYASAISFFGNKNITSGEGGALITNDEETFLYAKNIHSQGQSDKRFIHNNLGYNYRMTNVQAAILFGQIEILPEILEKKQKIFEKYRNFISNRDDISMQTIRPDTEHSNWMFGVRVKNSNYSATESFFKNRNIETRPMFYPIYCHDHLIKNKNVSWNKNENSELLNNECFILPSYPDLTHDDQKHILSSLENYLGQY